MAAERDGARACFGSNGRSRWPLGARSGFGRDRGSAPGLPPGFAALWDSSKRDDGVTVESCTIVTMPANALMTEIHNVKHRMPAILTKEDRDAWLTTTPDDAFKLLRQYPDTHMVATPVSKRVNTPKNNDAELIAPARVA